MTMIKKIRTVTSIAIVTSFALGALTAVAAPVAAPLGIEVGKTTCSQADTMNKDKWSGSRDTSAWSGGPVFHVSDLSGFHIDNLKEATIVCGKDDRTLMVDLTFDKGGMGNPNVNAIARQLDGKYAAVKKNLPSLGNGYGLWKTGNGTVEMQYQHVSFEFDVTYWAPGGREQYEATSAAKQKKAEQNTANQL